LSVCAFPRRASIPETDQVFKGKHFLRATPQR
jgi:hypothetical protein